MRDILTPVKKIVLGKIGCKKLLKNLNQYIRNYMSKYIRPATLEDAIRVSSRLLPADYSELTEGHGHDPVMALIFSFHGGDSITFVSPDNEELICGMAGVHANGQIWMLCTPEIYKYPHHFVRHAKQYVESRPEKLLWNFVDARNKFHLKLLRFLGFKFLRKFPHGPNNLSFIEFCRVQCSSDRTSSRSRRLSNASVREQQT